SQSLLSNLMLPLDEASPDKRDEYLLQSRLLPPRGDQPHPRGRDPGQCPPHALLALNHNLYPRDASFFVDGCCEPFHAFDGAEKGEVHGEGRDLHHEGRSPERPLEICGRVRGEYPPPVDYRHAVADRVYLCHVVRREEDRPPVELGEEPQVSPRRNVVVTRSLRSAGHVYHRPHLLGLARDVEPHHPRDTARR